MTAEASRLVPRFLAWLDEYYGFFRSEIGGRFGSWRDVRAVGAAGMSPATVALDAA